MPQGNSYGLGRDYPGIAFDLEGEEKERREEFLIPMAISLGFGIIFATGITLLLIPALYMVLEDFHGLFGLRAWLARRENRGSISSRS